MFFKSKSSTIISSFLVLLCSLSSCGLYEGPPKEKPVKYNDEEMKCLNDLKSRFESYLRGEGKTSDIDELALCLNSSFDNFIKYVRGEKQNRFSAQEVRNFLQHYIMGEVKITDGFVREVMILKQTFVGGKDSDFSLSDVEQGKKLVNEVAVILKKVHPHLPIDFDKIINNPDSQALEASTQAYIDAAQSLGEIIKNKNAKYSFSDLNRLISEIELLFPEIKFFKNMKQDLPRVVRLKNKLVTPFQKSEKLTPDEWKTLLTDGAEWMTLYLKFQHLKKHHSDLSRGYARSRLLELFDRGVVLTDRVIIRHRGVLKFETIDDFLDEFGYEGSFFGISLSPDTVKVSIRPIVKKVLSGSDLSENGRATDGVRRSHLLTAQSIFHEWAELMRITETIYSKLSGDALFEKSASYTNEDILNVDLKDFIASSPKPKFTGKMAQELSQLIIKFPSFVLGSNNQFLLSDDIKTRAKSFHDITRWTWLRPVFKYLLLGYMSPDKAVKTSLDQIDGEGLTIDEFTVFIHDLWPALLDLKRVGKRFNNPTDDSKKRFLEGSLFMFASNGDQKASVNEGLQLILYMISADKIGDQVHRVAAQNCKTNDRDEFGKLKVEPKCYSNSVYNFDLQKSPNREAWASFPRWVKYYETLNQSQRNNFTKLLLKICRRAEKLEDEWTGSDDTDTLVMLMHYVETLFSRYDTNNDGYLSPTEAKKSWPLFKQTLIQMPGFPKDSKTQEAVFAYILANGEPPLQGVDDKWNWDNITSKAGFWWDWIWPYEKDWSGYDFKSDRSKILMIFDSIKPKKQVTNRNNK